MTSASDGIEGLALSDTVLLQLIARRQTDASTEQLNDDSTAAADRQQSTTVGTKATTYAGKTNSRSATLSYHVHRQTRSSIHDYRHIAAALTSSPRKHLRPMPSPVFSDISRTATNVGEAEYRQCHSLQRTGGTCRRSSMTSHSRLPATTNDVHMKTSTTSSPVKCRISKRDIIADMGVTRQQFAWLREVGRCLNPHRRQQWSD